MFNGAGGDAQRFGHLGDFPGAALRSGIAEQQRSRMDKLGGGGLPAVRQCLQLTAFVFSECDFISGCHAPNHSQLDMVGQYAKYTVLHDTRFN